MTRHALILSALTFAVHFLWESIQCPVFFVHGSYDATWGGMVTAAAGDVVLTWVIYGAVAAISRSWRWPRSRWSAAQVLATVVAALALGIGVELRALETGRWAYQHSMPVIPYLGVGIVPLLQLVLLTPALVAATERLLRATGARDAEP